MVPPITIRYCLNCEKTTEFKYNKTIGHSRCVECDGYKCFNFDKHLSRYLEQRIKLQMYNDILSKLKTSKRCPNCNEGNPELCCIQFKEIERILKDVKNRNNQN